MSLTSQIKSPTSPFMRFAAVELPNSAAVTALKDGIHRRKIAAAASHDGKRPDWPLIGTSIDFRLRLAFSHTAPVPECAQRGYRGLARMARPGGCETLLSDLAAAITKLLAQGPPPGAAADAIHSESAEVELIRLCAVAAQLDQLYRNPLLIEKTVLLDDERRIVTLDRAVEQISWFVVDQIRDQVHLSGTGLAPVRSQFMQALPGPTFAGSDLIGGADADLLVDDLLLDFKSTHEATTIARRDVYQLAGYVLLDFDDVHEIRRVGVYWTRHGVLRILSTDTFFELLGARKPVDQLRSELRSLLGEDRAARQLALRKQIPAATSTDPAPQPAPVPVAPVRPGRIRAAIRTVRSALHR
ncbi:hypothetical protein [Rhodococcus sp. Q]|uniref:hypothetical protein n=1 Tax=Rhodococcus sp. Q TaxID=2502252 RepID=UPI0010F5E63A|nr:hypothetical protein [Rhodococcus sp. Q]